MKTYTEELGYKPFDWNAFLLNPPHRDDNDAWEKATALSNQWVTCACGNLCNVIPRDDAEAPLDSTLKELGYRFNDAIENRQVGVARSLLERIEARSTIVLADFYLKSAELNNPAT